MSYIKNKISILSLILLNIPGFTASKIRFFSITFVTGSIKFYKVYTYFIIFIGGLKFGGN